MIVVYLNLESPYDEWCCERKVCRVARRLQVGGAFKRYEVHERHRWIDNLSKCSVYGAFINWTEE